LSAAFKTLADGLSGRNRAAFPASPLRSRQAGIHPEDALNTKSPAIFRQRAAKLCGCSIADSLVAKAAADRHHVQAPTTHPAKLRTTMPARTSHTLRNPFGLPALIPLPGVRVMSIQWHDAVRVSLNGSTTVSVDSNELAAEMLLDPLWPSGERSARAREAILRAMARADDPGPTIVAQRAFAAAAEDVGLLMPEPPKSLAPAGFKSPSWNRNKRR